MRKIRIKSIKTFEEWDLCNRMIKHEFFTHSDYNPYQENDLKCIYSENLIIGTFIIEKINNKNVYLNHLVIQDSFRGKGLGLQVLKQIKKYMKFHDYNEISFKCEKKLIPFYKKEGFILKDQKDIYYSMEIKL